MAVKCHRLQQPGLQYQSGTSDRSIRTQDRKVVCNKGMSTQSMHRDHVVLLEVKTERELTDPVLTDVRVQAGRIVMAAGFMRSEKAVLVSTKSGTSRTEKPFSLVKSPKVEKLKCCCY